MFFLLLRERLRQARPASIREQTGKFTPRLTKCIILWDRERLYLAQTDSKDGREKENPRAEGEVASLWFSFLCPNNGFLGSRVGHTARTESARLADRGKRKFL